TIAYTPSSSSPGLETGSGIAGVQIVEVVSRVKEEIYTREANVSDNWSATAWTKGSTSGQSWANATTEVSTCAKVDVTKAPTLNVDSAVTATSVAVFGTGNLALTGTGALTASLFDATQLNGTLTLGTTGLLTTVVDTGAGTTVAVDTAENRTYSALTLAGAGTFQKLGAGTVTIAMSSCPIDLQAGGLTLTGAAPSKVTSLVGTTLTVDGAMTVTAETQIAGKLIKNGSGDLSVSNDGNVADVTVNGGNLKILDRSISQLGKVEMLGETELHVDSWNGKVTMNSLKLQDNATVAFANGNNTHGDGQIIVTEGITIVNGATFKGSEWGGNSKILCGASGTINGTGTLTLTKNGGSGWSIFAPIAGELKVVKEGLIDIVLTGAGTYTGGTEVLANTLTAKASSIGPGNVTVASGATLEISDRATNKLAINASKTLAGAGTITGNVSFA
ncbi:MAG: hypothetical protein RR007_07500, partial [Kiritimatiellia bacterium]